MEKQYLNILDLFDELNALAANTKETKMAQTQTQTQAQTQTTITTGSFIVGSIAPSTGVSFARAPAPHFSVADARSECERLARVNPGKTFFFVEVMGGAYIPTATLTKF